MSTENNSGVAAPQPAPLAKFGEKTLEAMKNKILSFIETGEIKTPQNYSVENNLRMAWLLLQDQMDKNNAPVLEVCTSASISNSLLKMVVQGLSVAKHQCAFVAYGNKLTFQRQYQGAIALAKRMSNVVDVKANAIFKGDDFAYEVNTDTGVKKVTRHVQSLEALDPENVIGAYAILTLEDGSVQHEIMNMKQIRKSWEMGATKGNSPAHKNFADEMACKTVISRACKLKIEASDDSDLYKDDEVDTMEAVSDQVKETVKAKANRRSISFADEEANVVEEHREDAAPKEEPAAENVKSSTQPQMAF